MAKETSKINWKQRSNKKIYNETEVILFKLKQRRNMELHWETCYVANTLNEYLLL